MIGRSVPFFGGTEPRRAPAAIVAGLPMTSQPPDGLPAYRLPTGKDDAAFCRRVSDALALGQVP